MVVALALTVLLSISKLGECWTGNSNSNSNTRSKIHIIAILRKAGKAAVSCTIVGSTIFSPIIGNQAAHAAQAAQAVQAADTAFANKDGSIRFSYVDM